MASTYAIVTSRPAHRFEKTPETQQAQQWSTGASDEGFSRHGQLKTTVASAASAAPSGRREAGRRDGGRARADRRRPRALAGRQAGRSIACTPSCIQNCAFPIAMGLTCFGTSRGKPSGSSALGGRMSQIRSSPGSRAIGLLVLTMVTWAAPARAQTQTIGGTIVDARSGLPIPDASVTVEGSTPAARSGTRGEFLLINVPGTTARLHITRIGYRVATVDAGVGDQAVRVPLTELAVKLDAVVV